MSFVFINVTTFISIAVKSRLGHVNVPPSMFWPFDMKFIEWPFLLKVRVLRVNLGRGKVKVVQVNRALVSWYYIAMNMESNRSLCHVNRGFELTGFASAVFFCDKKIMHNFSNESKNRIFYCNAVSCNERTVSIFSSKRKIMNFTFSIYFS